MSRTRMIFVAAVILTMLIAPSLPSPRVSHAQGREFWEPRYFETTQYWVQGPFRQYWETHGGLFAFGYPITGAFRHPDGLVKQYFERAIFEYHPEKAGTEYEVLLQRLGAIRTQDRRSEEPFRRLDGIESDANCNFYQETGHRLCFGFRNYWRDHGGLPIFGFPISEEFQERNQPPPAGDGQEYTVQYFERARFEWHPELRGTPYEVLLGLLGVEYLQQYGAPPEALAKQSPDAPPADLTAMYWESNPAFRYGFNVAWRGDDEAEEFNSQTMALVSQAGFNAVRIQVSWSSIEPQPGVYHFGGLDSLVRSAEMRNLRVLVSVVQAPEWATGDGSHGIPANPEPFERLMKEMMSRFGRRIDAVEIWNEQNLASETGGHVDLGRYVELLKAGYRGAKAGSPDTIVVFGGLTPTGVHDPAIAINDVSYLRDIYAYNGGEVKNYYDVLGAHPGSNNNSPDQMWPENPGPGDWTTHESFYFRRIEDLREIMVANGEGHKPIWITEFGWTTANPAPGYEYGADNTEQEQAAYLVRAIEIGRYEWDYVQAMYVWNLNFAVQVDAADEKGPWSVLNPDWSPRPAYEALKAMPKSY